MRTLGNVLGDVLWLLVSGRVKPPSPAEAAARSKRAVVKKTGPHSIEPEAQRPRLHINKFGVPYLVTMPNAKPRKPLRRTRRLKVHKFDGPRPEGRRRRALTPDVLARLRAA